MKRSDMIAIISDELCSFFPEIELNKRNLIADYMLATAEKNGMSPPSIATNRSGWEIGQGASAYVQEWEKE